jgi:hypothetical protein
MKFVDSGGCNPPALKPAMSPLLVAIQEKVRRTDGPACAGHGVNNTLRLSRVGATQNVVEMKERAQPATDMQRTPAVQGVCAGSRNALSALSSSSSS